MPTRSLSHKRILVTGGCGFIGSHFINHITTNRYLQVWNIDKLTYASNPDGVERHLDYHFFQGDICNPSDLREVLEKSRPHIVVHFAAETHVDRSIKDSLTFCLTNVVGTNLLLNFCRAVPDLELFVHVSTDEVYGPSKSISDAKFETDPMNPSSPYSASKAGGDHLAWAYHRTYGLPVVIVRPTNNYGPRQFPEKVIPVFSTRGVQNRSLPLYSKGDNQREWLHVSDCVRGIEYAMVKGKEGHAYNIGSGFHITNRRLAKDILGILGRSEDLIKSVEDRPGHDFMYAVNSSKIRSLGWKPLIPYRDGLKETVLWYKQNQSWCETMLRRLA